jgi:hypothetical protein
LAASLFGRRRRSCPRPLPLSSPDCLPRETNLRRSRLYLKGGFVMCVKCVELDGKIEHYQLMASRITDKAMLDGIKGLIEQMKAQKVALHPERMD